MKVALLHTRYGQERELDRYVHGLAGRLARAGHEVHVFCGSQDGSGDPGVELHRIPNRWKNLRFMRVWSFDRWLTREVSRAKFDVVHGFAQSSSQDIYTSVASTRRAATKKSLHGRQARAIEERRFKPGSFHKIVVHSPVEAKELKALHGLKDEDVTTVFPGVDVELYHPRNRETLGVEYRGRIVVSRDCFVVLCQGDGFRHVGVPALIEAARLIAERGGLPGGRQLRIAVVGEDCQKTEQRLSEFAKAQGVWNDVKFYGSQNRLECWHALADVFVFAARRDQFETSILSAMASGVPALVSGKVGGAELVRDGENGYVLPDPEDAVAIADRLQELAGDPEGLARLGAAARETAEAHSWSAHLAQIAALYEQVASLKQAANRS